MNLLLDTNIFVPLEPAGNADRADNTPLALELQRLAMRSGTSVFLHPVIQHDLDRDRDQSRAEMRRLVLGRYPLLPAPPGVERLNPELVGNPPAGSNDWVDNYLLAAIVGNATDILVTEDKDIRRKAERLGVAHRVRPLNVAVGILRDLFDETPTPPPQIVSLRAHEIDAADPIFHSLRTDYQPGFDEWLAACQRQHRQTYVVNDPESRGYAALSILKTEDRLPDGTRGKTLKLCTFKVSSSHGGNRYGELLLKTVMEFAVANEYAHVYFTVFPKYGDLIRFSEDFGFHLRGTKEETGELVMCKDLAFTPEERAALAPLDFHIRYGPGVTAFGGNAGFVVPIRPEYHRLLFPEAEAQGMFPLAVKPCGNSIKKAYLCHAVCRRLRPGHNAFFYRSKDVRGITAVGIVENTLVSQNTDEIARSVGSRTVYSYADIEKMCRHEVLAILFRLVKVFRVPVPLAALRAYRVLGGPPQSITQLSPEGIEWLRTETGM